MVVGLAVGAVLAVLAAGRWWAQPPAATTAAPAGGLRFDQVVLSPDGTDRLDVVRQGTGFTAAAPSGNRGTGLRIGVVPRGTAVTADEQVCVTWHGPVDGIAQAGLVLRVRADGERTRAILVTNNVFMSYRTGFNVHLLDSATTTRFEKIGGFGLPRSLGADPTTQAPLPWRMCARVVGSTVAVKAWPTTVRADEPAWDDPDATGSVPLPAGWAEPGRPGVFVGHLAPGELVTFTDLVVDRTP